MAKQPKVTIPPAAVRTRRAYFDCRFGQLHVRTAFPTTGGFDEQVTLFCLHADQSSSRAFARFLPEIASVRSVYAPDLPGLGESDPSPTASLAEAAGAVADLAGDLRLRQIDVLGLHTGARVAFDLAAGRPELVRRLILVGVLDTEQLPIVNQHALVMRTRPETPESALKLKAAVPHGKFIDIADFAPDQFDATPRALAAQIDAYLAG